MATTWSGSGGSVSGACTTGTESTLAAGDGIDLTQAGQFGGAITAVSVVIEVDAAGTIAANATLNAYHLNPQTSVWNRLPDLDLSLTSGLTGQASAGWPVACPRGRLAWLPNAVGGACHIYINATGRL